MKVFTFFKEFRAFERSMFPRLRSPRDFELIREIGSMQESGETVTLKQLTHSDLAPPATLHRALNRLVAMGIVRRSRSALDARSVNLTLAPGIATAYRRHVQESLGTRRESEAVPQ